MADAALISPALGVGTVVAEGKWQRFRLDGVVAADGGATVYRASAQEQGWYGRNPDDAVGDALFVVALGPEAVSPRPDSQTDWKGRAAWRRRVKIRLRAAMALVPPGLAGFPEWPRIRHDDAVVVANDLDAVPSWGVCQVATAQRRLRLATAEARRPHNVASASRRTILLGAGHRCRRCGLVERLEVDHVVPVGLGGTNDDANA